MPQAHHTWLTSYVDPMVLHIMFFDKFLIAFSEVPPSLSFSFWGRKPPSLHMVTSPGFLLAIPVPESPCEHRVFSAS